VRGLIGISCKSEKKKIPPLHKPNSQGWATQDCTNALDLRLFGGHTDIMATCEPSGIGHATNVTKAILLASLLLCSGNVFAQSVEKEPAAIVELGGAANWNIKDGGSAFVPTVAVEVTPIEKWLELEAGVTPLFSRHTTLFILTVEKC
jgi:hypothetical protein